MSAAATTAFVRRATSRMSARLARARVAAGMGAPAESDDGKAEEDMELLPARKKKLCVLCVGQTGSGKSSTVSRVTLKRAESSAGFERQTQECQAYRVASSSEEEDALLSDLWLVDTVGWQDEEADDQLIFQDILRFLRSSGFTHVHSVLWTVIPNVRRDAAFVKQAELINKFGASSSSSIWPRVVIVCKQSMRPERDGGGAIKAAEKYCEDLDHKPQVTGYRFLKDFEGDQLDKMESDPETRTAFNVKTDAEVRSHLRGCLLGCPGDPVELTFAENRRCLDCGCEGDERLMPLHCHMESHRVHPEETRRAHPGSVERYHPGSARAGHPGEMRRPWWGAVVGRQARRYSCCGRKASDRGCTVRWDCCDKAVETWDDSAKEDGCSERHSCCHQDASKIAEEDGGCATVYSCCSKVEGPLSSSSGCREECKRCGREWGTPADECYRTERHNVVSTDEENKEEDEAEKEEDEDRTVLDLPPEVYLRIM